MVAMRMNNQKQRLARASLEAMCILSGCIRDASACFTELRQGQAPFSAKRLAEYIHAQVVCVEKPADCAEVHYPHAEDVADADREAPVRANRKDSSWSSLPDECVTAIMHNLEGDELVMFSGVSSRLRSLSTEASLWLEFCSRLPAFCEDKTIETATQRGQWTDWARLYRELSRDAVCRALRSEVVLPSGSGMVTDGKVLRYSGEIGSDRAARAKEGWMLPSSLDADNTLSRLGMLAKANFWGYEASNLAWEVPPLLVFSENRQQARYMHAKCRYFEVKILPCSEPDVPVAADDGAVSLERWCIAVGVSTQAFSLEGMQPGWDLNSCAYHGDDGRVFFGNSCVSSLPKFGPGDTVGCGLACNGSLFFTKNGSFLGFVRDVTQHLCNGRGPSRTLYPTVGVDSLCPIEVNWGRSPFLYGFEELLAEEEQSSAGAAVSAGTRRMGAGPQYERFSQMLFDDAGDGCQCTIS
mmetsp:Transcript_14945/g.35437  ORF Transcript_14945/g.35437 Transcript_14945/m.35437 type:complete len:468 (-) Transcript_14945:70-1473(-)